MSPNFTCHLEMLLWIFWDYPAWVWMFVSDPQDVNPVSGGLVNCPLNPYVSLSLSESSWIVLRPKLLEFQMSVRFWIRSHFCDCMLCCWNIAKWVSILGEYVQYFQSSEKKCETWPDQPGVNFWFVPLTCMDVLSFELWRLHCAIVISLQNCLVILADFVANFEYSAWEKFCQGLLQKFWNSHIIILCITRGENAFVEKFWPENGLSRSRNGCFRACFRDNDLMSESSLEKWSTYSNALMQWFYAFCWVCLGCCVSIRCISLATRSVFAWL